MKRIPGCRVEARFDQAHIHSYCGEVKIDGRFRIDLTEARDTCHTRYSEYDLHNCMKYEKAIS